MPKRKTILQVNSVVNTGSTGRIAEEIGQTAITNGWESYIAYGRTSRTSKSELIRIGNDWDIKWHGIQTRLLDRHGFASYQATKALVNSIKQLSPDLIILHNLHGYYININVLFSYLSTCNIPVFWILYDAWAFTGHCTYFDSVGCSKWITGCNKCPQIKEYPSSLFVDNSKQNYLIKQQLFTSVNNLTIITHSNWLRSLVKSSFLKKNKVITVNNGVNTETFKPTNNNIKMRSKYNLDSDMIILGVAAEWTTRKGLDDFLKLSRKLNFNFKIILLGVSKKQKAILGANIIGILRTENIEDLCELYNVADVFINPTYEDNFPTTNLEALACGTPVITYNTGGSPEAIDNETGIIVKKGDVKGLVQAIMEIKAKGKSHYTKKCRERALKHFNKDDRYMDYIKLYEEIENE